MALHRTQLFLRPDQHTALSSIAERQDRTVSDVLRQVVDEWIEGQHVARDRGMAALERLRAIRLRIESEVGVLPADLILDTRRDLENRDVPRMDRPR